jgi:hypothetical protein
MEVHVTMEGYLSKHFTMEVHVTMECYLSKHVTMEVHVTMEGYLLSKHFTMTGYWLATHSTRPMDPSAEMQALVVTTRIKYLHVDTSRMDSI